MSLVINVLGVRPARCLRDERFAGIRANADVLRGKRRESTLCTTFVVLIDNWFIQDEPDTSCVEQLHVSPKEAFNKFKGKQIIGKPADFSDRVSNKPKTGYQ